MARYILLSLAALVAVAYAGKGKCPKVVGKFPFDETKFGGDWYSISGFSTFDMVEMMEKEECKCGKFSMSQMKEKKEDGSDMTAKYTALSVDNKPINYEAYMQSFKAEKASTSMGVWRKEGTTKWSGVFKSSIVATDYVTYAVIISCKPSFDEMTKTFGRSMSAQILSRGKTLSKDTLATLTNIVSGYDIDIKKLKMMDHSKCSQLPLSTPLLHKDATAAHKEPAHKETAHNHATHH